MGRVNVWIVLLLISVALNGVLIGAGARDWLAPQAVAPAAPGLEPAWRGGRGFDMRAFLAALPDDARSDARRRFEAARPELRDLLREAVAARHAAARAVAAEPFDPDAAATALAEARRARAAVEARTEALVLETAATLDAQTRRDALDAAMQRRGRGLAPGERR